MRPPPMMMLGTPQRPKERNHVGGEGDRDHVCLERELRGRDSPGVAKAGETVRDIKGAWVSQQTVKVENGAIVEFRTDLNVSFVLE
jgi:Dodecin